jgi:predicted TIM-barrel fold metal-dependent hydrolase
MHQIVRRAIAHRLPIQVHTGLQEGNGNIVANANPLHLANLLLAYPEARFDLFHAGYPFQSEMATLGKNFPNTYPDLSWVHVISPWVARQTLHEWLETVPANKIFAFGGDYIFVEGTYAHAQMARANVAQVLAEKVAMEYIGEDEALVLMRKLLYGNAATFFGLAAPGDSARQA